MILHRFTPTEVIGLNFGMRVRIADSIKPVSNYVLIGSGVSEFRYPNFAIRHKKWSPLQMCKYYLATL